MKNQSSEQVKNPELIEAMNAMLRLMDAHLLSPIERQTVLTETEGPSTRIRFEHIENAQGKKYYLAFTDMNEYAKWNEDETHNQALIMTMEDFGNILIRNLNDLEGFVINPYGENVSISKSLLLSLLKQREARNNTFQGN